MIDRYEQTETNKYEKTHTHARTHTHVHSHTHIVFHEERHTSQNKTIKLMCMQILCYNTNHETTLYLETTVFIRRNDFITRLPHLSIYSFVSKDHHHHHHYHQVVMTVQSWFSLAIRPYYPSLLVSPLGCIQGLHRADANLFVDQHWHVHVQVSIRKRPFRVHPNFSISAPNILLRWFVR